jgi:hypothetical protein
MVGTLMVDRRNTWTRSRAYLRIVEWLKKSSSPGMTSCRQRSTQQSRYGSSNGWLLADSSQKRREDGDLPSRC